MCPVSHSHITIVKHMSLSCLKHYNHKKHPAHDSQACVQPAFLPLVLPQIIYRQIQLFQIQLQGPFLHVHIQIPQMLPQMGQLFQILLFQGNGARIRIQVHHLAFPYLLKRLSLLHINSLCRALQTVPPEVPASRFPTRSQASASGARLYCNLAF